MGVLNEGVLSFVEKTQISGWMLVRPLQSVSLYQDFIIVCEVVSLGDDIIPI